ncbi:MAG TPA: ABC transporter permease [Gemmatimonadaceae bacterium]|nr:ABC transporter permease [Gemmatimonadaceae bacterium]
MSSDRQRHRGVNLPPSKGRIDSALHEEFQFHLEERIEQFMATGMTRAQAESEVRRRFGDVDTWHRMARAIDEETMRQNRRFELFDTLRRETARAFRVLLRTPTFSLVALFTLALGMGATTAIYTVLDAVVLRPLPYRDSHELVSLLHPATVPGSGERKWGLSSGGYFHFRENMKTLSAIGMYRSFGLTVTGDGGAEIARTALVTASMFDVLGARAEHGRLILPEDDRPDSARRVVLGYEFWQRRFGGDPEIVGKMLQTESGPLEIIGVTQPRLTLPMPGPFSSASALAGVGMDLWLPLKLNPAGPHWNNHPHVGVGRLAPGRTAEEAQREMTALTRQLPEAVPNAYSANFMSQYNFRGEAAPLKDAVLGPSLPRTMWMLFAAVLLVLLIAAANVAGLFVVRYEARRREASIRAALGADRRHMAAHYLSESLLLCAAAAVLGTWLSWIGLRAMLAIAPVDVPRLAGTSLGWPSMALTAVTALIAGFVFGLIPIIRGPAQVGTLREDGRGLTTSRRRRSARDALVVTQIAMALVLLASAGLMIRSFARLRDVKPGFDHQNVLAFDVSLPFPEYDTREKAIAFHREFQARIAALPGVRNVGGITNVPLEGYGTGCTVVWREGRPFASGEQPPCVSTPLASPGFLEALRIPVRGRTPTWADVESGSQAVVVTQALADRLWPGEDAIGKGINSNGSRSTTWYRVVGVVPELRAEALDRPPTEAVFYAMTGFTPNGRTGQANFLTYLVRTEGVNPTSLIAPIRRMLMEANPRVPFVEARTMDEVFAQSMSRTSFVMILLGVAAAVALALSAVGTYGVISYLVTQRRPEIGVRIALGASVGLVSRLVVLQSLRLALVGVVIGLVAALATTRLFSKLLFGVSPTDPVVMVSVAATLVLVAGLAAFAPARRAARIDPVEVLRENQD